MAEAKIPCSREAENYVLGSILIDEELANEFCSSLGEIDFYIKKNKYVS